MKRSVICFAAFLLVGLVSMGLLAQGLYYAISPLLNLKFPPIESWHGDWVWPAHIYVSVLWPFGFLISGWAHVRLTWRGLPKKVLCAIYIAILWLWALLLWLVMLNLLPKNGLD